MEHLGARLAVGDQAAFAELYQACADRLHHYLTVRLGSRQDAEDVLQETFVRLARNRGKLESVGNLAAYVFTIARNESNRLAERVAGPECAEMIRRRLVSAWQSRPRDDLRAVFRHRQQLMQLVLSEKGFIDAEEDPQVDRNRLGQPDRSALDRQRRLRVA